MKNKSCPHLEPFLIILEAQGAQILSVNEDLWSNCRLNIMLDTGPPLSEAEKFFRLSGKVKLWHNIDTHYAIETGLFCEECKYSLS